MEIDYKSPNVELGEVLCTIRDGKKTIIIREYGVEVFTPAMDLAKCKLEVVANFPRKIINTRQLKYRMQRSKKNGTKSTILSNR